MFYKLCKVFLFVAAYLQAVYSECRSTHPKPYKNISTKTPYSYIVAQLEQPREVKLPNCEAVNIWTVVRHGTRNPSKKAINMMKYTLPFLQDIILAATEQGKSKMCSQDVESLKKWTPPDIEVADEKHLHPEGDLEMILLGERFQMRFPRLLTEDYHEEHFHFRATRLQRAIASGRGFATGLFTRPVANRVQFMEPIIPHDPLIRFYKLCEKWKKEVKLNPLAQKPRQDFEKSEIMIQAIQNITTFLGLDQVQIPEGNKSENTGKQDLHDKEKETSEPVEGHKLTIDDLDAMYVMCNFDQAWKPSKLSPWCSVFNEEHLKMMEYREDLEYYWFDGYGYPVTAQSACVLIQDVFHKFLNKTKEIENNKRGSFYFTHSGTVLKLITLLNLFKDNDTLRGDNYHQMHQRKWKTSSFGAFGSNVALVLMKCQAEGQSNFKIGLYVNEKLELIPGCEDVWCSWDSFVSLFSEAVKLCNFEKICALDGNNNVTYQVADDRY